MKTCRVPVQKLIPEQIKSLYALMDRYYTGMTFTHFETDLREKDEVILLQLPDTTIVGFSTVQKISIAVRGKKVLALFSGDTVLEKEYWGNGALGLAFGRYLMHTKMRNPLTPTYWFLISKGYKTYLLMTNNFPVHYPRFEKKTPTLTQETMNTFYSLRYPKGYDAAAGLIRIPQENVALKYDVAEIDTEKLLKYPRIRFFVDKNPQWQQGVELACIAQVDMTISLRYVVKRIKKIFTTKGSQK